MVMNKPFLDMFSMCGSIYSGLKIPWTRESKQDIYKKEAQALGLWNELSAQAMKFELGTEKMPGGGAKFLV